MTEHLWFLSPLFTGIFVTLGVIVFFQILVRSIISRSGNISETINYLTGRLAIFSVCYFSILGIYFEFVVAREGHDLAFVNFRLLLLFYVTIYLGKRSSAVIVLMSFLARIILWGFTAGTIYFFTMTAIIYLLTLLLVSIVRKWQLPQIFLIGSLDVILGVLWLVFNYLQLPYFGAVTWKITLFNIFSFVVMNAVLEFGISHLNHENDYLTLLSRQATTDPLTKLNNYLSFKNDLETQVSAFQHTKHALTMLALDIGYFKRVNDDHGHLTGNEILQAVGKILVDESEKMPNAKVYRVGGEEFNIIMPNTDLPEAAKFSYHLQNRIRETTFPTNHLKLQITVSMGVAKLGPNDVTSNLFYERTDRMLYHSKGQGRDQVTIENEK
ncbi:GGDEF domain-containing protein [Pediococcus parvulus]|uniref:GGDEF domain-containing protein n=1 Tax=Pediococcus parvulus TaxID=54062 RepID=UPI0021A716BA|nr:GGDEF domain-containing protein [Pediococcus parvulus]MCT3030980.1 GGDEF domain-containing protein [Pediococcus parvulus]MCT3035687.1 GGDEF domain-containing protein [Pediococcus parvulus]